MEKMVTLPCSTDLKMALFSSGSRKLPAYSSSIVSLPVCSIRSARVCAKHLERNPTSPSPVSPKLKATQDLINGLKCEIANVQEDLERFHAVEGSDEFPFEIITRSGFGLKTKETVLQSELDDEVIRVSVVYETDEDEEEEDYDEEDEVEEEEEEDDDDVAEEDTVMAMEVNILQKSTGQQLNLDVTSFPDEIIVDDFSIKKPEQYDLDVTQTGGKYLDNLQKELIKYLEVRGVTRKTIKLWKARLKNKEGRESVANMKGFKAFMEKSTVFTSAN